jgi:SP family myo-inositol transporter-like MFS transporter 13
LSCSTGVISSTLVSIGTDLSSNKLPLTTLHKSLITSATSFFALVASPTGGYLADTLGRRTCILLADVLFIIGALWQAFATSVPSMVLGRSVVGLAVGAASFVTPLYIAELAPRTVRGRLITVNALFITGGQVVAYLIGWAFAGTGAGWRWMVGLGAAPAIAQAVLMFGMPETPRWLVQREKKDRARAVLVKVYGAGQDNVVQSILKSVEDEIREERASRKVVGGGDGKVAGVGETFAELLRVGGNKRALIISCLLQGAQQLCGFNSLMYFSATIFAMIGFTNPIATSLTIACTNFVFTLITFNFIDRVGRRRILLISIPFMVIGLALCAVAFHFVHLPKNEAGTAGFGRLLLLLRRQESQSTPAGPWALVIVASMIIYVAAYALGLGCVPWQQSELFPLSVRSLGSGIATGTNWLCNTIVGFTFLPMMQLFTPSGTFAVYAAVCAGSWLAVWMIYPETAGLGLEDVRKILENGWGVKESLKTFRERKRMGR